MTNLPSRGFKKVVGLTAAALLLAFGLRVVDAIGNAKYSGRDVVCRANLRWIGVSIAQYRLAHRGQMPPSLKSLMPQYLTESVLLCPVSGTVAAPVYTDRSYTYRFVSRPRAVDIVAWDSGPHVPGHSVFVWLNRAIRHVLYADGRVGTVPEAQFARLGLRGASLVLWQQ